MTRSRLVVAFLRLARMAYAQQVRDLYRDGRVDAAIVLEQVPQDITRLIQTLNREERR